MKIQSITTTKAPAAIGPYSQAVKAGGFLFLSGQIGLDPATGSLVSADLGAQTRQVLANLKAVLAVENLDFGNVVETTIYLTAIEDFQAVNSIYAEAMADNRPARATVAVAQLPKMAKIEIKMTALLS